ncbi:hypothetical protein BSPLISOX_1433, partial [uncultured Gammaproteobacteria bacterium]
MQINHIKIKNFKSLKNVDVRLNNLTLITGVNSSGKSSFIQSLLFFRENRENILAINQFNKGHSYPASFNGKYIKLGEEALLFSQNTFNEDIMFELVAELDNIKISINKKQEISLISDLKKLDISKLLTGLFSDHCFHYLSTERASPDSTFGFSQQDINLNSIGVNGKYTAHYLAENRHKSLD